MLFQILKGPMFLCAYDFTSDASKVSSSVSLILEIRLINKFISKHKNKDHTHYCLFSVVTT